MTVAPVPEAAMSILAQALSYRAGETGTPLFEETLGRLLRRAASTWPSVDALISRDEGIRWSFSELDAAVDRVVAGLLGLGLSPGDRIAVWAPNCANWTLLQFAAARAGLIFVTFNTAYRTVELDHVLRLSGARAIVAASGFKDIDYAAELASIAAPKLEFRIMLGDPPPGWISFASLSAHSGEQLDLAPGSHAVVNIQFTSGTTGRPKGVALTHRNLTNNGSAVGARAGVRAGDRVCIPVPLYHCFGMVMGNIGCIASGATMVYPSASFDADRALAAIEDEACTHCYGVPTMFIAMLESASFAARKLGSLRGGIMAGSTCPIEVMRRIVGQMHMTEVTIAYGMTETSPVSLQTSVDDPLEHRVETVGRVMPHVEVKIVDEDGAVVPIGVQGELCTRGYSVMAGYWDDEAATSAAIDRSGFMHSGDLATMDGEGFVRITGRAKDMIIRGGENISPREIEEYLYSHPDICDVAVVGIPHPRFGEQVCAWVVPRGDCPLSEKDVVAFCKGRLAHYKIPSIVRLVSDLPTTASGKIQKYVIRDRMSSE